MGGSFYISIKCDVIRQLSYYNDGPHPAGCTVSVEESSNIGQDAFPLTDNRCQSDTIPLSEPEDLELDHSEGITEIQLNQKIM